MSCLQGSHSYYTDLALRLREARIRAGLTQADVARISGLGDKSISAWETHREQSIKFRDVERYARACGITVVELLTFDLNEEVIPPRITRTGRRNKHAAVR